MNAQTEFKAPAKLRALRDIVEEYDTKRESTQSIKDEFSALVTKVGMAGSIGGTFGDSVWDRGAPSLSVHSVHKALLISAWKHVWAGLNLDVIATATDRKKWEMTVQNPPEFTLENIAATFGDYVKDPRFHILRGLAECFCDLDQAYKSHSKVKIGVAGLPKRIIVNGVMGEYSYGSYGRNKLRDVIKSLNTYRGVADMTHSEFKDMIREARKSGDADWPGGTVKAFRNGNAHVIFDRDAQRDINRALAEFYGDILPDAEADGDVKAKPGTEVSKDLAYYPTPERVLDKISSSMNLRDNWSVLEPSCGDGQILDWLRKQNSTITLTGVEVDPGRAASGRAKGHAIMCHNFLKTAPDPRFDLVIMNPPFSGQHWKKHLLHARKFLKPVPEGQRWGGGNLICILPASAFYDGHLGEMGLVRADAHNSDRGWRDTGWHDLPTASFADSGTNVPTGYFVLGAKE